MSLTQEDLAALDRVGGCLYVAKGHIDGNLADLASPLLAEAMALVDDLRRRLRKRPRQDVLTRALCDIAAAALRNNGQLARDADDETLATIGRHAARYAEAADIMQAKDPTP